MECMKFTVKLAKQPHDFSLSNGLVFEKDAYFCRNLFLQTGLGISFPLESIFPRKFIDRSKFSKKYPKSKHPLSTKSEQCSVLMLMLSWVVEILICDSYLGTLFLKVPYQANLLTQKKVLRQNQFIKEVWSFFSILN